MADYTACTVRVVYNNNGGSGSIGPQEKKFAIQSLPTNVTVLILSGTPSRSGYTFAGWAYSAGATSGNLQPGGSMVVTLTEAGTKTVNLYAVWSPIYYSITYKPGASGTGSETVQTKAGAASVTLKGAIFTRTGYEQIGWSTSDGGSQTYALGATYTANASITLYPVWKSLISTFTVTSSVPADGSTTGTVTITRQSSSYTHTVKVTLGSRSQTFTDVATSKSFTIPASWVDQIPSATSKTGTVTVTTYSGSTELGSNSKSFTVTVPSSVKPTVSLAGTNQSDNNTVSGWGILVQGYSKIKLTATVSAGTGSSITSVSFSGDGANRTSTGTVITSSLLKNSGSRTWKVVVTDARGRTASATLTRTVYEYYPTSILTLTAKRSNSSGTAAPADGTYINAKGTYSFASCNGHNSATVKKIEYKLHTASSWTSGVSSATSGTAYTFGGGNISILSTYDVRMTVTDALGSTATYTVNVSSVQGVSFGLNGQCARFGGPVQYSDRFECDWDAQFDKTINVINRQASASLSAVGWYRVLTYAGSSENGAKGTPSRLFAFRITRTYTNTNNELHEVKLLQNFDAYRFADERSYSNTQLIDQIRVTRNGSNSYVDIHYTGTSENTVYVDFDVYTSLGSKQVITTNNLAAVADAPTGETIEATYTLMKSSGASISFTPTSGSAYSTYGNCWYAKDGNMVEVHVGIQGLTASTNTVIYTLPEGFRPKSLYVTTGNGSTISNLARMRIETDGRIRIYSASTTALVDGMFICAL